MKKPKYRIRVNTVPEGGYPMPAEWRRPEKEQRTRVRLYKVFVLWRHLGEYPKPR